MEIQEDSGVHNDEGVTNRWRGLYNDRAGNNVTRDKTRPGVEYNVTDKNNHVMGVQ